MSEGDLFYTETMAKINVAQGRFQEAAQIYRHLIRTHPGNRRLIPELVEAEKKALEKKRSEASEKMSRWIRLLMRLRSREALVRIQSRYALGK